MNFCFRNNPIKKIPQALIFPICLFALPFTLFAQSGIGFHIGKSYSRFEVAESQVKFYDFSNDFEHEGLKAELYYSYSFNKYLSLKPSLGYVKRGAIIKRDYGWVGFDKFSLKYLDFSASIGFSPIKYLTLNCGLSYNYLLEASAYWGRDGVGYTTDHYKRFDFGLNWGGTVTVKNIFIKANYFRSIKPTRVIDFSSFNPDIENTEYRNRSIEVSIGYQLNIGKKKDSD